MSLLNKFSSENKSVILPGDFDVNLVKYDNHHSTNVDYLSSYLFLSYITEPTRIRAPSKALIGNIFSNVLIKNTILGNITATTSDHLSPLIALPNIFSNPPSNKSNIYERDWSNVVQENFILKHFPVDWNFIINKDHKDLDLSFNNF